MQIVAAMLLDAIFGDPSRVPHPVALVGRTISFWEGALRRDGSLKAKGFVFCAAVLLTVGLAVFLAQALASRLHWSLAAALELYLLYSALAYRSLKDEAICVASALTGDGLPLARRRLSRIVGRDTSALLEGGIVRATVETVAESYVDGVVSVIFYMTLGYFFGSAALCAWIFKAVSTMDSMVGYDDARYSRFGFAAAKLDDAANFIPARLGALLAVAAASFSGHDCTHALKILRRDRLKHKSPNSAHGESVFAGLLGITLGGGASYGGVYEKRPWLGDGLREPEPQDIWRACDILDRSYMLCTLLVFIITGAAYV